jgi:hypothetical protein
MNMLMIRSTTIQKMLAITTLPAKRYGDSMTNIPILSLVFSFTTHLQTE